MFHLSTWHFLLYWVTPQGCSSCLSLFSFLLLLFVLSCSFCPSSLFLTFAVVLDFCLQFMTQTIDKKGDQLTRTMHWSSQDVATTLIYQLWWMTRWTASFSVSFVMSALLSCRTTRNSTMFSPLCVRVFGCSWLAPKVNIYLLLQKSRLLTGIK